MSTTWRKNYFFKRIFKARRERTKRRKSAALFQPLNPSSGQTDFRRTLLGAPAKVSALSCVAAENLHPGAGMLTGFPFEGSTNPCPTAICTRGRSTRGHPQGFVTDLHACLLAGA
ncbi:hypothetical protein EJ07DRAFT_147194 [Lizonia empirigonia]|nr:hypothetical protein EJ07DRAFT_148938 [Lizonia empirigonia]KAF1343763.1 hypothetical protein EJ07DRAFT_147799 [Lizonia empirigonia]KAF1345006.1 hypothetical protein EJ07DRAFT_147194 [Lizonia empirigonia]